VARLEDLTVDAEVCGIVPNQTVRIVSSRWMCASALSVVYKDQRGQTHDILLFRDREQALEVVAAGSPWNFDVDPARFRRVLEAVRLRWIPSIEPPRQSDQIRS